MLNIISTPNKLKPIFWNNYNALYCKQQIKYVFPTTGGGALQLSFSMYSLHSSTY